MFFTTIRYCFKNLSCQNSSFTGYIQFNNCQYIFPSFINGLRTMVNRVKNDFQLLGFFIVQRKMNGLQHYLNFPLSNWAFRFTILDQFNHLSSYS